MAPAPALAQKQSGKDKRTEELVRKGLEAYAAGDYATAANTFEVAYDRNPDQQVLFAWAQSERFRGNCRRAIELFGRLLEGKLSKDNRRAVKASMAECEKKMAAEPAAKPPPPDDSGTSGDDETPGETESEGDDASDGATASAASGSDSERVAMGGNIGDSPDDIVSSPTPPRRDGGRPWYADPIGGTLTGAGVIAIGLGIGLYVSASSANSSAEDAQTYTEFSDLKDDARSRGRLAVASLSAGAVLVSAGLAWYLLKPSKSSRSSESSSGDGLSAWWQPGAGGISFAGEF